MRVMKVYFYCYRNTRNVKSSALKSKLCFVPDMCVFLSSKKFLRFLLKQNKNMTTTILWINLNSKLPHFIKS